MNVFLCASRSAYYRVGDVRNDLERRGHLVTLPNNFEDPGREDVVKRSGSAAYAAWKAEMLRLQGTKVAANDAILVLNFDKGDQRNYLGGATFLEVFCAWELGKAIYFYNPLPESILRDELEAMGPMDIEGDLDRMPTTAGTIASPMTTKVGRPDDVIAGATAAHRSLLATIGPLTDSDVKQPSLLTDWTVAHVLTHLARNADSYVRMLEAAARGQSVAQYAEGLEGRAADIEVGSRRPAPELIADVRQSCRRLEAIWDASPPNAWAGHGYNSAGGDWPCAILPFHRWREVEVHHADLGFGFHWADWSDGYIDRELPRALASVPDRLRVPMARRRLTAWLLGRTDTPGELALEGWQDRIEYYHR